MAWEKAQRVKLWMKGIANQAGAIRNSPDTKGERGGVGGIGRLGLIHIYYWYYV